MPNIHVFIEASQQEATFYARDEVADYKTKTYAESVTLHMTQSHFI